MSVEPTLDKVHRSFQSSACIILLLAFLMMNAGCSSGRAVDTEPTNSDAFSGTLTAKGKMPAWIWNPDLRGYCGAVGCGKTQPGGIEVQETVALTLGKSELAKRQRILIESICNRETQVTFKKNVIQKYASKFACDSKHRSEYGYFGRYDLVTVEKDRWIDPVSGDLYIWIVIADNP